MCGLPGFCECGWAVWVMVLLTLIGMPLFLVGFVLAVMRKATPAMIVGVLVVLIGLTSGAAGLIGRSSGMTKVEQAVSGASIDPAQKERILAVGRSEADMCISWGVGTGAILVFFGLLSAGLGLALRPKKPA